MLNFNEELVCITREGNTIATPPLIQQSGPNLSLIPKYCKMPLPEIFRFCFKLFTNFTRLIFWQVECFNETSLRPIPAVEGDREHDGVQKENDGHPLVVDSVWIEICC